MREKSAAGQKKLEGAPPEWCKSCSHRELCQTMCAPLVRYLNGKFHARHSVKHRNETDHQVSVNEAFDLREVADPRSTRARNG